MKEADGQMFNFRHSQTLWPLTSVAPNRCNTPRIGIIKLTPEPPAKISPTAASPILSQLGIHCHHLPRIRPHPPHELPTHPESAQAI